MVQLTYDLTHTMLEENLVVLDVFFQSLIADSVTEVAQYNVSIHNLTTQKLECIDDITYHSL